MGRYRAEHGKENFVKEMYWKGIYSAGVAIVIAIAYTLFFAGIGVKDILMLTPAAILIAVFLEFVLAPISNEKITEKISISLENTSEMSLVERTSLLRKVLYCPRWIAIEVAAYFFIGILIWNFSFYYVFHLPFVTVCYAFFAGIYCAYIGGLFAYSGALDLCRKISSRLVKEGVDVDIVQKSKFYGFSYGKMIFLYILVPVIFDNTLHLFYLNRLFALGNISVSHVVRMFVLVVIGSSLNIFMSMILTRRSINIANKLNENLRSLTTADILSTDFLSSDLSDEFSFAIFMQNQVNDKLHNFASNADMISKDVINNTENLVDAIEQASSTAIEQSAGTKECYSTMEEEASNLKNIFQNIKNVAATAQRTSEYVEEGMRILNESLQNMHDIEKSNQNTSSEIYILVSKISDMKNIISDIDALVDKTRGIAFNAGLKASRSETAGRNFNIVANEVRRLANTISSSTKGINKIIAEVLQSADNLTMTSEGGSEKISEGKECLKNVQENFNEVRISSEITADSASNIENITLQMSTSFDQISSTIEQLSVGIHDLSNNVESIQTVTKELDAYSAELKSKLEKSDNNISNLKLVEDK